ncbi:MAG TPA: DinB family protein [Pyrinomonadaceae bacterium]|nr:DinB family protein [Pyrinomonadaceae bacterium]
MDNLETLRELFRHMEWADAMVWTAVLAHEAAAEDDSLKERLSHIHFVQLAFLKVWRGEEVNVEEAESLQDMRAVLSWARSNYAELNEYTRGLENMDMERPIVMPWIKMFEARLGRKADAPSFHETLLQVAMHTAYHRGQVATRLRQLGGEPPLTDFIVWVWVGKPEPSWPPA